MSELEPNLSGSIDTEAFEEASYILAEAKNFDINPYLVRLMSNDPFFASVSRRIKKKRSLAIPTAGVTVSMGQLIMVWNPIFFSQLDKDHVVGVLKHEFYHIIFEHILSRKMENHTIWNYSTDWAINSLIPRNQLPDCALVPGEYSRFDEELDPDGNRKKFAEFQKNLPTMQSSEWYYYQVLNSEEMKETIESISQPTSGPFDPSGPPGQFDSHDDWGDLSSVQKEILKEKIRGIISQATNEADSCNRWGDVPHEVRSELRKVVSNQVNWRNILRSFCGMANSSTKHNTRTRRNRKYGLVHPGKRRDHRARILIAVDQSGSVFNEDLEMFFGECGNLSKHISFDIINFDAKIDEESLYKWKRGEKHDPIRTRFGGTDFNAPTEYVNVNRANYDAVIILTDGQAPKPKPCLVRRAWVICPNNDLYFETNEMVIKLRNEKS